jgi:XRE family aerobic/anaerobic benzoate catabolism transcriptional regulator
MHYTAVADPRRDARRRGLLQGLAAAVRAQRAEHGLTRKALAQTAHVSERFLAELESGEGNISVVRLQEIAEALDTTAAALLARAATTEPARAPGVIALLGLRGAGKTSIGQRVARRLGIPFVELDALVATEAGMSLATIFELHGEQYFRRVEREALVRFLDTTPSAVLATSGSLVTDASTFALLRRRATTVWLKARAKDHWDRVVLQGDGRPMQDRENAMSELKALLAARKPLYARAEHVLDTSAVSLDDAVERVVVKTGQREKAKPVEKEKRS